VQAPGLSPFSPVFPLVYLCMERVPLPESGTTPDLVSAPHAMRCDAPTHKQVGGDRMRGGGTGAGGRAWHGCRLALAASSQDMNAVESHRRQDTARRAQTCGSRRRRFGTVCVVTSEREGRGGTLQLCPGTVRFRWSWYRGVTCSTSCHPSSVRCEQNFHYSISAWLVITGIFLLVRGPKRSSRQTNSSLPEYAYLVSLPCLSRTHSQPARVSSSRKGGQNACSDPADGAVPSAGDGQQIASPHEATIGRVSRSLVKRPMLLVSSLTAG
jgi:hypothetical protein